MTLTTHIRAERTRQGLSQVELAAQARVQRESLIGWELRPIHRLDVAAFARVAHVLGFSDPLRLLHWEPPEPRPSRKPKR